LQGRCGRCLLRPINTRADVKHLSFAALSSRVLNRLAGCKALEDFACETHVLCQPEDEAMRPAIYAPGEIDRITGVHEFSAGLEDEIHLATRDSVHHTETVAYRLRNICLMDGQLCNYRSYRQLRFGRLGVTPPRWLEEITETAALASTAAGNDYFAHFLLDDIPTALLGQQFGLAVFGGARRPRTAHMLDYLKLLDAPYQEVKHAWFRDLWIFKDYPQTSHRRVRLQQLRSTLSERFRPGGDSAPTYIRRGNSGSKRMLANEAEIEALLAARGFNIIDPEALTAAQICAALNGSPLVVGVEGSQLVHGILNLRSGGTLLCIQPASRFNAVYRGFTNTLDLNWGFVVADGTTDSFRIPTERLLTAVELTLERIYQPC
jgi:Glycosyltransferase 61